MEYRVTLTKRATVWVEADTEDDAHDRALEETADGCAYELVDWEVRPSRKGGAIKVPRS